ncbi:MAG TPA: four helix bundle protein [Candidatus Polarisedimenticolia bacterium]|nr:four helix bundle protein [Candidatus Polarisedimenticolia bacterium]
MADFSTTELYKRAQELTRLVYRLEDRFPEAEMPVLFLRLREAAVDLGAAVALGFGRDGGEPAGRLSEAAAREVRGRVAVLRHFVLTSAAQFHLDERHVEEFDRTADEIQRLLGGPAGGP